MRRDKGAYMHFAPNAGDVTRANIALFELYFRVIKLVVYLYSTQTQCVKRLHLFHVFYSHFIFQSKFTSKMISLPVSSALNLHYVYKLLMKRLYKDRVIL